MQLPTIAKPYLLFLGDSPDLLTAKTAIGVAHWRPEWCAGQMRLEGCKADAGLPDMTIAEAATRGVGTLIVGVATTGGVLPDGWTGYMVAAIEAGLDIASGLHSRLADIPAIAEAAARHGRQVFDVRHPAQAFECGTGNKRPGKRLLTVGTDCCVGKMYAALAIAREMEERGMDVDFRATGQTGIFIAGGGVSVDAVVADFISGATEALSPAADPDHWDIVEGQGSLLHPAYAGVSLGLLHGSQPDALVMCHEAGRLVMDDMDGRPMPGIEESIDANLRAARVTNADVQMAGICLNTRLLGEAEALALIAETGERFGLPCADPVRTGVDPLVDRIGTL
ncbi:MAG: DUF1611 domain-containing protein [Alphaproteobacteria bacterium]|nr:DUF1611 domain-containing protein [Alphaproteobacteria bacterium]